MESTAIIAEWHNPRLQQVRTSPNTTAVNTKKGKKNHLLLEGLRQARYPHHHCQP